MRGYWVINVVLLFTIFSLMIPFSGMIQSYATTIINENAKLTASDPASFDVFGQRVSISGDTAVVGARQDSDDGLRSGSAYVFTKSGGTWTEQTKLTASDAAAEDRFGFDVSISGDTIVVGSAGDDDVGSSSGSAYVFTRSGGTWTEQAKLIPSGASAGDQFGESVSISGDTVVIGSSRDGSAYVFTRSGGTWTEQAKLTASDAATGDQFGKRLSVSDDTVVVAVAQDDDDGNNSGSAIVFTRSAGTWTEQAKLTASDAVAEDQFGWSVSVSGDTIVVGSVGDDDDGAFSGSAYVFTRSGGTWTEQAKLTSSDAAAGDQFGNSASISGDTTVVGSFVDSDAGFNSGSAYVFTRSGGTWTELAKLTASDAQNRDRFGNSVSISGDIVLIGAYLDDDVFAGSGSAYIFDFGVPPDNTTAESPVVLLNGGLGSVGGVEIRFSNVITGGITDVAISEGGPPPPAGFRIIGINGQPTYYDFTTTATFSGNIEVCINYDESDVQGSEANLQLRHFNGGSTDITNLPVNEFDNIICGTTTTLSFFAVMELICPAGSFASVGATECTPTPPGSYVDTPGAADPILCPVGTSNSLTGSTSLSACITAPTGSYVDTPGAADPILCPIGTSNSLTGSTSLSACITAPTGSYVDTPGATDPILCPIGTSNSRTG